MALSIDSTSALLTNQQASRTEEDKALGLARMSAAKRITKAADDAAGLSLSDALASQARAMGQSARNAADAAAILQIADGALGQATSLVQSIRENALQAANASQSTASRQALQADIDSALKQLGSIAQNTTYNGQSLLSGRFSEKTFQIGSAEAVSLNLVSVDPAMLGGPENGMLAEIDITTPEGAQAAVDIADKALERINANRSNVGSTLNQLTSTINNLTTSEINTRAAGSRVSDLDLAEESIVLARIDALRQAQGFASAQANAGNKTVINLLQNDM